MTDESMRVDFFISYTSKDSNWAQWIAMQLEDAGYRTIIQAWDIRPGSNFVAEMDEAAKRAERTIPVLSSMYLKSDYAFTEWAAAFRHDPRGKHGQVLPVRIERCQVDGLLGPLVYIDLVDLDEHQAREKLLEGVKRGRAKPPTVPFPASLSRQEPQVLLERPAFPGISMEYEQNLDALLAKIDNQEYLILVNTFATELQGALEFAQELFNRGGKIWQNECKRVIDFLRQIDDPLSPGDSTNAPFEEILFNDIILRIQQKIKQLTGYIEDFSSDCEGSTQYLYIKLQKVLKTLNIVLPQVSVLANKLLYKLQSIKVKTNLPAEGHTHSSQETIFEPPME